MSIFKSTFKPYIARQINTRQKLLNQQGERGLEIQKYVSGKSPWLKMTSLVNYNGSIDLAKKYVLMGGTLYPDINDSSNQRFSLRSGINTRGAAYGDLGDRQYGIRPMPGIESADIKTKSAYGSLREATIKYYAWDKKQHDDLAILFQTPGYPVLLEWGWSMYLDTTKKGEHYDAPTDSKAITESSNIRIASDVSSVYVFEDKMRQTDIYNKLEMMRHKHSGNYDGMLGFIRNFEWALMPGGGYECTVVLISIGDVLDTIKMNSFTGNQNLTGDAADYKDEFEVLLTRYASINSEAERETFNDIKAIDQLIDSTGYTGKIDKQIYKIRPEGGKNPGIDNSYMQLGLLIFIINNTRNLFLDNEEKLIDIEIPIPSISKNKGNGLCVASKYSISIDPGTCIIRNSQADIFTSYPDFTNTPQQGFNPRTFIYNNATSINYSYLNDSGTLGTIGHIYINIGKVIAIYKSISLNNNGTVGVGKYLTGILDAVSYALGSVNNFAKYVEDNKAVIIDTAYTEISSNTKKANKFTLNLAGTNSIVRNHQIKSKIFPNQANMIAIGAGAGSNLGSVQASTYNYMNEGITSRLYYEMSDSPTKNTEESDKARLKKIYEENILKLVEYVNQNVLIYGSVGNAGETIISTMNTYLNTLLVKIVEDTNYKAIVPISLEATIDGIGGLTIGEIFTVNKDILPKQYQDRSIGFIVTGISNNISKPDWKTTLSTQVCLLDQDKFAAKITESYSNLKAGLFGLTSDIKMSLSEDIRNFNTIISFFADFFNQRFYYDYVSLTYIEKPETGALNINKNQNLITDDSLDQILNLFGNVITIGATGTGGSLPLNGQSVSPAAPTATGPLIDFTTYTKNTLNQKFITTGIEFGLGEYEVLQRGKTKDTKDKLFSNKQVGPLYNLVVYRQSNNALFKRDTANLGLFIKSVGLSYNLPYYTNIKNAEIKSLLQAEINNMVSRMKNNYDNDISSYYLLLDSVGTATGTFIPKKMTVLIKAAAVNIISNSPQSTTGGR
jgi:hypothetical protein